MRLNGVFEGWTLVLGAKRATDEGVRRRVRLELTAVTGLILSYIWLWQGSFPVSLGLCLGLFLAISLSSHRRAGETLAEIGFSTTNLLNSARLSALVVGPVLVKTGAVAILVFGTVPFAESTFSGTEVASELGWGILQQYILLGFYLRRFKEILGGVGATLAAAGVFSLFHLPNPFLAVTCFACGLVSSWIYAKAPNFWVLGMTHALVASTFSESLPEWLTGGMKVGPGYLKFVGLTEG